MPNNYQDTNLLKYHRKRLIEELRNLGISNPDVLAVMRNTPRHIFIDEALVSHAYTNNALPIGYGQTISQPYIVARMTEALLAKDTPNKVLEVGTGCGYQTAVLAQLINNVYSVERIQNLANKACNYLNKLEFYNILLHHSDGHWGWPEMGPYQGIIVTAAPATVPKQLLEQLEIGGRLIIPIGPRGQQVLLKITRTHHNYEQSVLENVSFVPMLQGLD